MTKAGRFGPICGAESPDRRPCCVMVPGHDGPHAWATLPPDPDPRDAELAALRERAEVAERCVEDMKKRHEALAAKFLQMAESESNRALRAENDRLRTESIALRADMLAVAHATGIVYEADGHASQPGPTDAIVASIRETVIEARELRAERDALRARLDQAVTVLSRFVLWWDLDGRGGSPVRPIVESALALLKSKGDTDG